MVSREAPQDRDADAEEAVALTVLAASRLEESPKMCRIVRVRLRTQRESEPSKIRTGTRTTTLPRSRYHVRRGGRGGAVMV